MPCMPRPKNKATKIAEVVLGTSKKKKKRENLAVDKEPVTGK